MFQSAGLLAMPEDGCAWANEVELAPLHCEIRASILKRGLLRIISDCSNNLVAEILAFVCADEND